MKLYSSRGTCSLASIISLREAGIAFELVKVDLRAKTTADGRNYLDINPKGYVPTLELDDGTVLTENVAVLAYIADLSHGVALRGDAMARYRLLEWLGFISSEIHKSFSPFFNPATPDAYKDILRANLSKRLGYLQEVLTSRPCLMGAEFAVADAYLFTVLRWSGKVALDLAQWPAVKRYFDDIAKRPRIAETLPAEGLA